MKRLTIVLISFLYCVNSFAELTPEDMALVEYGADLSTDKETSNKTREEVIAEINKKQKVKIIAQLSKISKAMVKLEEEISKNKKDGNDVQSIIKKLENNQDKISKRLSKELDSFNQTTSSILRLSHVPSEMIVLQDTLSLQQKRSGVLAVFKKQLSNSVEKSKKSLSKLAENLEEQKQKKLELAKIVSKLDRKKKSLADLKEQQKKVLAIPAEIRMKMKNDAVFLAQDLNLNRFLSKIRKKNVIAKTSLSGIKLPIIGKIVKNYHSKDRITELPIQGIVIEGGSRGKIKAMHDGRVIYSGQFREYGHLVILEHQTGAHSLYAGFGKALVDVGDYVNSGNLLGFLPVEEEPTLYYEVRINNVGQNPKKWLTKDLNKA